MKRMYGLLTALALAAAPGEYFAQVEAVKADYNAQCLQGYHGARYLYVGAVAPEKRAELVTALKFWLPHLSRAKPLEHQVPVQVGETDMYRIDIDRLDWGRNAWLTLAKEYPYADFVDPLVIRGDWLVNVTSDTVESQSYYTLLFSDGVPKNKQEYLKAFDIVVNDEERTATIIDEGKSGVAYRTRVVVEGPVSAGFWWESYDSRDGFGGADILNQGLDLKKLKFDAQEYLVPMRKFSLATGERGITISYFLTNAAGARQEAAPVDIVKDHTQFLGIPEIRTPGHCVACHAAFNGASENAFREWVKLGIERREKDKETQEFREQFLLSKHEKIIERGNEDFETFAQLACGVSAKEAQQAYVAAAEQYDAPVTLEQAAIEACAKDAETLSRAIAMYSEVAGPLEGYGRLVSLAHGRTVSRRQWEGDVEKGEPGAYHQALAALKFWNER